MLKVITVTIGDKAYDQYSDFIDQKSNFIVLDVDRLDELFFQSLKISKFPDLSQVAMIMFTISNGLADVERFFNQCPSYRCKHESKFNEKPTVGERSHEKTWSKAIHCHSH